MSSNHDIKDIKILSLLAKNIRGVERTFGDYLFNTYVLSKINLDGLSKEEKQKKIKESKKKFENDFYCTKPQTISQKDQIIKDIEDIEMADDIYENNPEYEIKVNKTIYGYPDRYRCEYIILSKHKYHRCKAKVMLNEEYAKTVDKDIDIEERNDFIYEYCCSHHFNMKNEHLTEYNKLVELYKSS
jgi:hypothetical protein